MRIGGGERMSNKKEKRDKYAHETRGMILNNPNLDAVTKEVLMRMFDTIHNGMIWVNSIESRLRDVEKGINDKDAQDRR